MTTNTLAQAVAAMALIMAAPASAQDTAAAATTAVTADAAARDDISVTTVTAGTGPMLTDGDTIVIDYTLTLPDGSVADQGQRSSFTVGGLIPGFDMALRQMQPGGIYRFRVPAGLAYGAAGSGPIPPGSDLMFDVTVHSAQSAAAARAALLAANPIGLDTLVAGTGAHPGDADIAVVSYTGRLTNGTQFDSGASVPLPVGGVIPGFAEGLKRMQVGGRYRLSIPAALAYGAHGAGPIPPNSDLVFEVTLHSIQTAGARGTPR